MDKLFFKVWRNIFINKTIFKFIRFFKNYNTIKLNRIEDIRDFPNIGYYKTIIYDGTDEFISGEDFPKSLHSISILYDKYKCEQPIESQLSNGLKEFIYPKYNNKITRLLLFPTSVETVMNATFIRSDTYEQNESDDSPPDRKVIIPNNIKSLSIFRCPNHKLSKWLSISTSLTSLDLGPYWYNGNIELKPKDLPNHLKHLSLHLIKPLFIFKRNCLPNQLESLTLTTTEKYFMDESEVIFELDSLPLSLRKLDISHLIPKLILPINSFENLTWLRLNFSNKKQTSTLLKDILPPNLKTLILTVSKITIQPNVLPNSITYLKLEDYHWSYENIFKLEDLNFFPSSLNKLILNCKIHRSIKHINLPNTIENLKLGIRFNKSITIQSITMPTSIKKLTINCNKLVENYVFPNSIKYLKFGSWYGFQFNSNYIIPESVETLVIKSNQPISKGFIPEKLKVLKLIGDFDKPINFQLPKTIEKLIIGNSFDQSLNETLLPQSITF
ncbi:hypothetical protein ACTFIY_011784 [Dictyostelium cf. discoideum]